MIRADGSIDDTANVLAAIQAAALAEHYALATEIAERYGLTMCIRCLVEPATETLPGRVLTRRAFCSPCREVANAALERHIQRVERSAPDIAARLREAVRQGVP